MNFNKEDILRTLDTVEDPDLKQGLVSLNMIKDIQITRSQVSFTIILTTPACPLKELIKSRCEKAIHELIDKNLSVKIHFTSHVTSLREGNILPNVKNIIAISSGKGGVGKSTITANLALALSKVGAKVGIIDADIFGPSIPIMFNTENAKPGLMKKAGKNRIIPIEQYGIKLLSIGYLTSAESAVIWRGPMASSALKQFINDTEWGNLDYLLIDLPPGTSDIHLTLVQTITITGAVIITTPQKVALADAQKGIAMFRQKQINVPLLGVIENMAYFIPTEFPEKKYYIFGKDGGKILAERYEVPFLGKIPLEQNICESADGGLPVVLKDNILAKSFEKVAGELVRNIAIRNVIDLQTQEISVKQHN